MVVLPTLEIEVNKKTVSRIFELAQKTGALLYGDFTLASGLKSPYYFDGRMLTLHPEGALAVGKAFLEELRNVQIDAIGGLETGAIPIVASVALLSQQEGKPIPAFFVRKEAKRHGLKKAIEGHFDRGMKVAIVDDVITTGGSVVDAIRTVESQGGKVVKVMVLVDRRQGGSDDLKKQGYDVTALLSLSPTGETLVEETATT